jgi:hypothetical protein
MNFEGILNEGSEGLETSLFEIPCWIFDIQYSFKLSRLNKLATAVHIEHN